VPETPIQVGFFATCLIDFFRPSAGFAAVKLLEDAGCRVSVPPAQTCCGQPAYNGGDRDDAKALATRVIETFAGFDRVVVPSGSCAAMLRIHYPRLFEGDGEMEPRARDLAERTYELVSFLTDERGVTSVDSDFQGTVAYHDSCSCRRELSIGEQPRRLLRSIPGVELREITEGEVCCGFGGAFSVKYPEISMRLAADKAARIRETGAATLTGADLGCLLHLAGELARDGAPVRVHHVAELLAGAPARPPIGGAG
jgi:L-lactate dehydrogenase complex protein LldE